MTYGSCHRICESKVQACVNPSRSALCANLTTRQAGGSVWKVTPKSISSSSSIFSRTRGRTRRAERQVDPAGEVPLHSTEPTAPPPEGRAGCPAEQRVEPVGQEPERGERRAEYEDLRPGVAARGVHELRQEGQEEQRDLGVEDL